MANIDIHYLPPEKDAPPLVFEHGGILHHWLPPQMHWRKVRCKYIRGRKLDPQTKNATNRLDEQIMEEAWLAEPDYKGALPEATRKNIRSMPESARKALKKNGYRAQTIILEEADKIDFSKLENIEAKQAQMMPFSAEDEEVAYYVSELYDPDTRKWVRLGSDRHLRMRAVRGLHIYATPEDELLNYKERKGKTSAELLEDQRREVKAIERSNDLAAAEAFAKKFGLPVDAVGRFVEAERKKAAQAKQK